VVVAAAVVVGWVMVSDWVDTWVSEDGAADEGSASWVGSDTGFGITLATEALWAAVFEGDGGGPVVEWGVAVSVWVSVESVSWLSLSLALAESVGGWANVGSASWVGSDTGAKTVVVSVVWVSVESVSWLSLGLSLSGSLAKVMVGDQWCWPASVASGLESGSAHAGPVLLVEVAVAIVAWLSSDGSRQSKENNEKLHFGKCV